MILGAVRICGKLPLNVNLLISICSKHASAPSSGGGKQEFSAG